VFCRLSTAACCQGFPVGRTSKTLGRSLPPLCNSPRSFSALLSQTSFFLAAPGSPGRNLCHIVVFQVSSPSPPQPPFPTGCFRRGPLAARPPSAPGLCRPKRHRRPLLSGLGGAGGNDHGQEDGVETPSTCSCADALPSAARGAALSLPIAAPRPALLTSRHPHSIIERPFGRSSVRECSRALFEPCRRSEARERDGRAAIPCAAVAAERFVDERIRLPPAERHSSAPARRRSRPSIHPAPTIHHRLGACTNTVNFNLPARPRAARPLGHHGMPLSRRCPLSHPG